MGTNCTSCGVGLGLEGAHLNDIGEPVCVNCAQTRHATPTTSKSEYDAFAAELDVDGGDYGSNAGWIAESAFSGSLEGTMIRWGIKLLILVAVGVAIALTQ